MQKSNIYNFFTTPMHKQEILLFVTSKVKVLKQQTQIDSRNLWIVWLIIILQQIEIFKVDIKMLYKRMAIVKKVENSKTDTLFFWGGGL